MLSTKQLFILIIYLLLLPHSISAMKRSRNRSTRVIQTSQQPTQNSICPKLPEDLWTSIAIEGLSNLKALHQTSSYIRSTLNNTITLDSLDTIITTHPEKAKEVAQNFYLCTKLLYRFGMQHNEENFNTLWNSQSINDKGIRAHFVKEVALDIEQESQEKSISPFQIFGDIAVSRPRKKSIYSNSYYYFKVLMDYLYTALRKSSHQSVHLATSFALHNKITLQSHQITLNNIRTTPGPIFFLMKACQHSTVECLHMLLELGIDPSLRPEKQYGDRRNILHLILDSNNEIIVDHKAEKIELILQYYNKIHALENFPKKHTLVNCSIARGTPLSFVIEMFICGIIPLDELIDIINVLLKYGADPKIPIYKKSQFNVTAFDRIAGYETNYIDKITQEEADIIIKCLNKE